MPREILLPIDLEHDTSWQTALPAALEQCRITDARLHLLAVVPPIDATWVGQFFPDDFEDKAGTAARERLRALAAAHVPAEIEVRCHVAFGAVYRAIIEATETLGIGLVVMAAHRPELGDYLLGSNAAKVVRHATCSVLVIRQ